MPYQFIFENEEGDHHFDCRFHSQRCQFVRANGVRCKNKVVMGLPLCHTHLLSQRHLKIKVSTIPYAGKGLFALDKSEPMNAVIFRKGEKIIDYIGEHIDLQELNHRYDEYTAPYAVGINRNTFIDPACERGVGAFANTKLRKNDNNATFSTNPRNRTASIKATKNIRNGEEIFVYYGNEYNLNEDTSHKTKYVR